MERFNRKSHWEDIYENKPLESVSWYQPNPETSLNFIDQSDLLKTARIIDIGGGDSFFADHLLDLGFENITVLDISSTAIDRAKERLGNRASKITWVVSDILDFLPKQQYDFWHDRATFHFLTKEDEINHYVKTVSKALSSTGTLVIGTFSEQGPTKCSGIDIKQYSTSSLIDLFQHNFERINCLEVDHQTPFDTNQNFVFCSFRKK